MFNETMLALGKKRSCIRELFEYGLRQAQVVGKENVYDYSLGNPSIPAPPEVNETFIRVIREMDSLAVHSYTPAPGAYDARKAVADELNERFGTAIRPENIFFTCGAAPALLSVIKALAVPDAEIIGLAPYFPEYRPFTEASGARFVEVPADYTAFQVNLEALEAHITPHTQAVIVNSPNNPSGVVYSRETLTKLAALLERKGAEIGHAIYRPVHPDDLQEHRRVLLLLQVPVPSGRAYRLRLRARRRGRERRSVRRGRRGRAGHGPRLRALAAAARGGAVHGLAPERRRL